MGSRGSKKKSNPNYESKKTKIQNRKIWWEFNKKKIITLCVVFIAIAGIITIASITSSAKNHVSTDGQYTLIDFGSKDCQPCIMLQPVLESLRTKYRGKININYYDIQNTVEGAQLGRQYNISSMPTLVFLDQNNKEVYRSVGYKTQTQIEDDFRRLGWI